MVQDRASPSSSHQVGEEDPTVRIEVFAHGAIGKEAVLVASLSNSVLLVMRIGGGEGGGLEGDGNGLRSWLLDWPVSGKVRIDGSQYGVARAVFVSFCSTQVRWTTLLADLSTLVYRSHTQPGQPKDTRRGVVKLAFFIVIGTRREERIYGDLFERGVVVRSLLPYN